MKKYLIKDDIYGQHFFLVVCPWSEWSKYTKKNYDDDEYEEMLGRRVTYKNVDSGEVKHYVMVSRFDWAIKDQCVLLHELVHQAVRALDDCGVKWDANNHEHFAYYYEYLVEKVWNKLKPKKKS